MRNVELFIDTYLSKFTLFSDLNKVLSLYNTYNSLDSTSQYELEARTLFADFVDIANTLDTYNRWTDENWKNFLVGMVQAFGNKGLAPAVSGALSAYGIIVGEVSNNGEVVDSKVKVEDKVENEVYTTVITVNMVRVNTPPISIFFSNFKALLPKLLWLRNAVKLSTTLNEVRVEFTGSSEVLARIISQPLYMCEAT